MTEQPTHMLIADPEMIDGLSMTRIISQAVVSKEDRESIAGSKTNVPRSPRFPNLRAILGEGISVVAIDYRLIGKHTEGVMPPVKAPLHDAAQAARGPIDNRTLGVAL